MTYFIHKTKSGTAPQSGYERISVYRNPETSEIWVLWRTDNTDIRSAIEGDVYIVGEDDATINAIYPDLLLQKRSRIRAVGATKLTNIAGEYMPEERETWAEQKDQATRWLAGDASGCEMLVAFAAGRGIPTDALAQGIVDNNALFQVASGQIMGAMYALLDQVNAAPDLNTALNVEWS